MAFLRGILAIVFLNLGLITSAMSQSKVRSNQKEKGATFISLADFIDQVKVGHKSYQGSEVLEEGAKLRENEGYLLTRPAFLGTAQSITDKRETGSSLQGNETTTEAYSLGFRQHFSFGLDARLLYSYNYTTIPGANPMFVTEREYYTAGPSLELTQPLGRNGFGTETRATRSLLLAQSKATQFGENFRQKQILAEAEIAYWRLVVAREAVAAQKESVERAERLKSWSANRQRLNLGNRGDYLQTEAAYLARNLELEAAIDEEEAAARAFNTLRGQSDGEVPEILSSFDSSAVERLKVPERSEFRDDVRAAEQQKIAAEANTEINAQKNKPTVNLVGTVGYNGRDRESQTAIEEAARDKNPYYSVGVRLDIPLDFATQSRAREGYRRDAVAADLNYQRKIFEQEQLWVDLTKKFNDSIVRYRLALQIEKVQKDKVENERSRHNRGLTTTFQVLQFEQDFANSQLARIRAQAEVVNIYAQLKTFGGNP